MDTSTPNEHTLRYPIGRFFLPERVSENDRAAGIAAIAALPAQLSSAVDGLNGDQLNTPYREGGWTIRQLVHHVADSHINAYARFRLALTEDWPVIKAYEEARWAELEDARNLPVEVSLALLESLHRRWWVLLQSLDGGDWRRGYVHPENGRQRLDQVLASYSWHGRHHTAHVTGLRHRSGWK